MALTVCIRPVLGRDGCTIYHFNFSCPNFCAESHSNKNSNGTCIKDVVGKIYYNQRKRFKSVTYRDMTCSCKGSFVHRGPCIFHGKTKLLQCQCDGIHISVDAGQKRTETSFGVTITSRDVISCAEML